MESNYKYFYRFIILAFRRRQSQNGYGQCVYEKNPFAIKKCIELHEVMHCQISEMNFEEEYGDVGRDFIHVHHLKPLHEIQQD